MIGQLFYDAGFELYLVGGSVRDSLLKRESNDDDYCTNASAVQIAAILEGNNLPVYRVGEKFGTIGTELSGRKIEITQYRGDDYGRKPEVTFVSSLEHDIQRRDATLNAIAKNALTGEIVDLQGGVEDIINRTIRAVGNPYQRVSDDPLRILRFVRLSAQLGFTIEEATAQACADSAQLLSTISRERVRDELVKILTSANPAVGLRLCRDLGLLPFISEHLANLVGCLDTSSFHRNNPDVFEHTLVVVSATSGLIPRLAALLHDCGKPATRTITDGLTHFIQHEDVGANLARDILRELSFDNETVRAVVNVVHLHMRRLNVSPRAARRLILDGGNDLPALLDVMQADALDSGGDTADLLAVLDAVNVPANLLVSPLSGEDIMVLTGLGPGRQIGAIKNALQSAVVDGTLNPGDRAGAEALVRNLM